MLINIGAYQDGGFWCARGIGISVFTQGNTFNDQLTNVREAVFLHFSEKLAAGETFHVLVTKSN